MHGNALPSTSMNLAKSTAELRAASERFRGFFNELGRSFVERDDLLAQVALALLSREHVLMTGPPPRGFCGVAARPRRGPREDAVPGARDHAHRSTRSGGSGRRRLAPSSSEAGARASR